MKLSFRFLPATIFAATLLLTVRAGDIWRDVTGILGAGGVHVADAAAQQKPAAAPGQAQAGAEAPGPAPGQPGAAGAPAPIEIVPEKAAEAPAEGEATPRPREATRGRPMRRLADDPTLLTQTEIDLLQQLAERRDRVEKREQELDVRTALLKAAEARIDKKVEEMKTLQSTIEGLLASYDQEQEKKVAGLVKIYENMKPKDAAKIFEELEMDVLLMVVERVNSRRLAPIMAAMNPQKAREVTVELSRLRQLPEGIGAPGS